MGAGHSILVSTVEKTRMASKKCGDDAAGAARDEATRRRALSHVRLSAGRTWPAGLILIRVQEETKLQGRRSLLAGDSRR